MYLIIKFNPINQKGTTGSQCHSAAAMIAVLFTINNIKAGILMLTASHMELNNVKQATLCSKIIISEITGLSGSRNSRFSH